MQLQRERFHARRVDRDVLNENRVSSEQNQGISTDCACLRLGSHDPGAARPHVRRTCAHWNRWQEMLAGLVLEAAAGLKSLDGVMGVSVGGGHARWMWDGARRDHRIHMAISINIRYACACILAHFGKNVRTRGNFKTTSIIRCFYFMLVP